MIIRILEILIFIMFLMLVFITTNTIYDILYKKDFVIKPSVMEKNLKEIIYEK